MRQANLAPQTFLIYTPLPKFLPIHISVKIMKHIKVLPLEFPYNLSINHFMYDFIQEELEELYEEIDPVFNREGKYYDRKKKVAWVECYGKAYKIDSAQFEYKLKIDGHTPLRPEVAKAINLLMQERLCPKSLQRLLWMDIDWKQLRNTGRRSRIDRKKRLGR